MNLPPRQRMARELRERCRQLPGGSRLDTVRKLMEEYTTSQRTVEQVLNELAARRAAGTPSRLRLVCPG